MTGHRYSNSNFSFALSCKKQKHTEKLNFDFLWVEKKKRRVFLDGRTVLGFVAQSLNQS